MMVTTSIFVIVIRQRADCATNAHETNEDRRASFSLIVHTFHCACRIIPRLLSAVHVVRICAWLASPATMAVPLVGSRLTYI